MQMNELGFYTLAGAPRSPRDLIDEVQAAEALGIGACFISERFNIKEAATLSGAVGAVSIADRHCDRRDEPEHAPSARHRGIRDDDAFPDRRPLCAWVSAAAST